VVLPIAFAASATAQVPAPAPPGDVTVAAGPASPDTVPVLESTRASVRSTAEWLARGVDSWFGDRPFKDGGKVTDGRMAVYLLKRQDESLDVNVRFNARFRLPNLEESAYLFFGRDNQRDLITDRPGPFTRQQRLLTETAANQSFFAGFGLALQESVDFRLGFRGGLNPPRCATASPGCVRSTGGLRQTVFWSLSDPSGPPRRFNMPIRRPGGPLADGGHDHPESKKFEWSSIVGTYKSLGGQRLLSFEALASGEQRPHLGLSDLGVQAKWEQPVYKNWLLGEVVVGHFWPRKDPLTPRGKAWALGAGLKMQF
jgi:hypothetical protein